MEIKLTTKSVAWGIVIIVVIAAIAAWGWTEVAQSENPNGPSPYSAVYLTSGDVYFGRFSRFPEPHMTDVWYLNRATGANGEPQFSVVPFKSAAWGPAGDITLNPSQILFTAPISKSSPLIGSLESAMTPSSAPVTPPAMPSSSATSSSG